MAVGTIAAAPSPWNPRRTSNPISFGMKGMIIDMTVTQAEPKMKMSRLP